MNTCHKYLQIVHIMLDKEKSKLSWQQLNPSAGKEPGREYIWNRGALGGLKSTTVSRHIVLD